jgi:macrodomain Ter protein organizer (MatP/YcbG family)
MAHDVRDDAVRRELERRRLRVVANSWADDDAVDVASGARQTYVRLYNERDEHVSSGLGDTLEQAVRIALKRLVQAERDSPYP